jgi:alanine racemase
MPDGLDFTAVVKDNGCGHGSLVMAEAAIEAGATMLAVSCMSEAVELRKNGIREFPILVFGERAKHELQTCIDLNLTLQVQTLKIAEKLSSLALKNETEARVHFKVDSGMGRYGVRWDEAAAVYRQIRKMPGLHVEGIMTHFAQSDESDKTFANLQWERFQSVIQELENEGVLPEKVHACNSGGYLDLPHAHGNMVRLGALPTGVYPSRVCRRINIQGEELHPVMQVKTRIAMIRELNPGDTSGYGMHFKADKLTKIAVLPFGYGDGYPRMRNQGQVLVNGEFAPVIGGMAMDATMVDISHLKGLKPGEEVVMLGRQGKNEITARNIADWAGTVTYDILSRWNQRVERVLI